MVVYKTVKSVDRLRPTGIEQSHTRGGSGRKSFGAHGHVRDVSGNQPIGFGDSPHDLALRSEKGDAVRRGDECNLALRIVDDPIDAKHLIVLYVGHGLCTIGRRDIETMI